MENQGLLRFGNFEFRPATGELQRDGALVRLQAQPAQVLGLLLRNPGTVITRTELKDAIWGTGTYVDFDRGLNFCIAQLRAALGDSAEASVYIRTLPKRGYQSTPSTTTRR
ncbi:MAG TPA: winged helix-turn-helix domain-containing protein [Terracidiphilus sp.]|nr:winged helix-turn-helix domain-containing protein [Terracidiphilus sp.]